MKIPFNFPVDLVNMGNNNKIIEKLLKPNGTLRMEKWPAILHANINLLPATRNEWMAAVATTTTAAGSVHHTYLCVRCILYL